MKNINNFTQCKMDQSMWRSRAITHQKHLAQSERSTWSAVDIFNTLHVFTKEPIREQEIKLAWSVWINHKAMKEKTNKQTKNLFYDSLAPSRQAC